MSNPNEVPKVESPKVEVIGAVKPVKVKSDAPSAFTKDNFLTALVIIMGGFQTKLIASSHSALLSQKQFELAHKLLLVSGAEFIFVLFLFLSYIIASKFVK
tara:strand:+ start:223 stop:525 length:303 start_codon:yes stop_codon:yes gene_type:complete